VLGFGSDTLMLVHETNQPPTSFNDSGDAADEAGAGICAGSLR
jgi:hypothetical protein